MRNQTASYVDVFTVVVVVVVINNKKHLYSAKSIIVLVVLAVVTWSSSSSLMSLLSWLFSPSWLSPSMSWLLMYSFHGCCFRCRGSRCVTVAVAVIAVVIVTYQVLRFPIGVCRMTICHSLSCTSHRKLTLMPSSVLEEESVGWAEVWKEKNHNVYY